MTNLLITGALGHIGSRLIHSIRPDNFNSVCMIDNLSTQRYSSLFNLPKDVKFSFVEGNICDMGLDKYFKDVDVAVSYTHLTLPTILLV